MRFDIITLFPAFFSGPLDFGVLKRAQNEGRVTVATHDLRRFAHDRHRTVDDRPFGGGEGMVLKPEPLYEAISSLGLAAKPERDRERSSVVLLSAQGRRFTQAVAADLARLDRVVLICGRYEGVDERVNEMLCDRELSIGDYVLSGGEIAAAVLIDAVTRLLPGVLGNADSARFESFGASEQRDRSVDGVPYTTHGSGGILDYPHYTRPADFLGVPVPPTLQSGNHLSVRSWRRRMALRKTLLNRPDLLAHAALSNEDHVILAELQEEQRRESEAQSPDS